MCQHRTSLIKTAVNLPTMLEEFREILSQFIKGTTEGGIYKKNRKDLQTLGSQPVIMPKNLPHWQPAVELQITRILTDRA